MNLTEKHKENLITQRALLLFFYNFTNHYEIIEEMIAENSGFKHSWEKLELKSKERHEKNGGMRIIQFTELYELFATQLTYPTQALFIEKILKAYGDEARRNIEFSMMIEEKVKAVQTK